MAEQPAVGDLALAFLDLPRGFCDIYGQSTKRIDQQSMTLRKLAKRVLACVAFARRPVSVLELQRAVADEPGTQEVDEMFFPSVNTIVSISEGLLSYDPESRELSLVHHTLQGYLEHQAAATSWFQDVAPKNAANASIAGFNFTDFRSWGFGGVAQPFTANQLLGYVANGWDEARGSEKGRQNSDASFVGEANSVKIEAGSDTTLDRKMSWLLLSRGSY
ncbi:hypothetical protein Neosp_003388 [[Neocosmospora] mangrovei]